MSSSTEPDQPLGTRPAGAATAPRTGPSAGTAGPAPGAAPAAPKGPGVVRRTTDGIKRILLVLVGAIAALFAVLNRQDVEVHWIFGDAVRTPLILAIVVTFLAGAILGWLVAKLGSRASHAHER